MKLTNKEIDRLIENCIVRNNCALCATHPNCAIAEYCNKPKFRYCIKPNLANKDIPFSIQAKQGEKL